MSARNGSRDEMDETLRFLRMRDPMQLDDRTVDRLLDGMPADDAPPNYQRVAGVMGALTAAPTAAELAGERQAVAAITAQLDTAASTSSPRRRSTVNRKRRFQMAGATLVGTATLFVGLGAAGALPGAAQGVASDMLGTVGVSVPSPDSHAGTHPDVRGNSGNSGADATSTDAGSSGKGSTISSIATDKSTTGVDKGAAVSSAASDGRSQAGVNGDASSGATTPEQAGNAPVPTPNPGGTTTADTASGGKADAGTTTGDTASDGRAADGSTNADAGLSRRP